MEISIDFNFGADPATVNFLDLEDNCGCDVSHSYKETPTNKIFDYETDVSCNDVIYKYIMKYECL